jgi:hypothetical protein
MPLCERSMVLLNFCSAVRHADNDNSASKVQWQSEKQTGLRHGSPDTQPRAVRHLDLNGEAFCVPLRCPACSTQCHATFHHVSCACGAADLP